MTRDKAIKWFKEIQGGSGVDRSKFPNKMKGAIAKKLWDEDPIFSYGIEYGILIALREIYKITDDDIIILDAEHNRL